MTYRERGRREFVSAIVVGGLMTVTGCTGASDGDTGGTDNAGDTNGRTPTSADGTTSPTSDSSSLTAGETGNSTDPVAVVRQYLEAADAGDREAANALVASEDSPVYLEETPSYNVTINSLERCSERDVLLQDSTTVSDQQVATAQASMQDFLTEEGYEGYAFVCASLTQDSQTTEGYYILVQDNGEWRIMGVG